MFNARHRSAGTPFAFSTRVTTVPAEPMPETAPEAPAPPFPAPVLSPQLGPKLAADYEALRNDLEQAQEIAAEFQREIAGKSNEIAGMRQLLEKTQLHLEKMEANVSQLRRERHDLANRVMASAATELKLERSVAECERLRREAEALQGAVQAAAQTAAEESQAEIRRLEIENARLLTQIEALTLRGAAPANLPADLSDAASQGALLARILTTVEEVRDAVNQIPRNSAPEFIDISFDA